MSGLISTHEIENLYIVKFNEWFIRSIGDENYIFKDNLYVVDIDKIEKNSNTGSYTLFITDPLFDKDIKIEESYSSKLDFTKYFDFIKPVPEKLLTDYERRNKTISSIGIARIMQLINIDKSVYDDILGIEIPKEESILEDDQPKIRRKKRHEKNS